MSARKLSKPKVKTGKAVERQAKRHVKLAAGVFRTCMTHQRQVLDQIEAQAMENRKQGERIVAAADEMLARIKRDRADIVKRERELARSMGGAGA